MQSTCIIAGSVVVFVQLTASFEQHNPTPECCQCYATMHVSLTAHQHDMSNRCMRCNRVQGDSQSATGLAEAYTKGIAVLRLMLTVVDR